MPRHAAPRRVPLATAPSLSPTAWRRLRRGLTAGVFTLATALGVTVGFSGTSVSPVAPAATATAVAADPTPAPREVTAPQGRDRTTPVRARRRGDSPAAPDARDGLGR